MTGHRDVAQELPLAEELAAVFARMSGLLLDEETTSTTLRVVTSLARQILPGTVGAGISLLDAGGERTTVASTDPLVEHADGLQYQLGEGPCLTAWQERTTVQVADVGREERWPRWCAAVRPAGVGSCLSAALVAGDAALGALKVYSSEPDNYGTGSEHALQMFAAQAAGVIAGVQAAERGRRLSDDLRNAVRSRDVVSVAKGIVMEREHVAEEDAFAVLVAHARTEGVPLRVVAENLMRSTVRRRR